MDRLKIRLVLIPTLSPGSSPTRPPAERKSSKGQRGPWQTFMVLIPASAIAKNDILAVYIFKGTNF